MGSLTADQVETAVLQATAAPSLRNCQPWLVRSTPHGIELHADRTRMAPVADGDCRELMLACGAALMNLRLAIGSFGRYPEVHTFPDPARPDLLAVVLPGGPRPVAPIDRALAAEIPRHRTNRRPFAPVPVPAPLRRELQMAAETERAWLAIVDPARLSALHELVREAHRRQLDDARSRAEWTPRTGGVPAQCGGPLAEPQDEWVLRDCSGGRAAPGEHVDPLIVVLGSFQDGPAARLQAGQAMQRVLLTATAAGLSASLLSQVVEVAATREQLRALIGGGLWPQTVLRIGYGLPVPATPRRGVADVVLVDEYASARGGRTG
ncbi:hypothetical protein GCM10011581_17010 [Saccharopolyspora subtropica]|uniref:Nitroreductase family protein n=1 Tax=Saccharopolyspora thermophila TaxID=89367 RepID=A0A917N9D3_9PSEU|nr:hypothetical protein GCM10011581_17010 [Saccharopolyspora subtropica]